jgi:iron complex outermembrane receptor protein
MGADPALRRPGAFRTIAVATAMALVPSAARAERPVAIDIPAGQLGRALALLSQQANEDIGTADTRLPLRPSPAVRGSFTVRQALDRLLATNEAVAIRTGPRSWRIALRPIGPKRPLPSPVSAPSEGPVADIVVTGTKRAVPLSAYPGTATILDLDTAGKAGAPAGTDTIESRLSTVASTHFGSGRDKIFVRGVADSGFSGPNQATTGQYLNDTRLTYNAPDPNLRLYDIARVEILEGPQGALYGAGSLGGVIRVVTTRPQLDRISARGSAGFAVTAHGDPSTDLAGVINVPLVRGTVALRLVGYAMQDGGYIDDPAAQRDDINRVRTGGLRAGLRVASGDWLIDMDGAWQGINGADSQWTDADAGPLERNGAPLGYRSDYLLGDVTLSRSWGDLDFISTTSASHQYLIEHYDATEGNTLPVTARQINRTTLFANETRLSRRTDDAAGWMVGLSLLHNHSVLDRLTTDSAGGTSPHQFAVNNAWEETLFGEAGIHLPADLLATLGARLTNAQSDGRATAYIETTTIPIFGSPVSGHGAQQKFRVVPTIALSGHPAEGVLLFARLQQGFRPGGFGISNSHARKYDGDRVTTIEAGMRIGDRSRPFEIAATLSYTDWRDILAEVVTLSGDPITENIGDGRIASFEARATWRPVARLSIDGGLFANHSRLYRPAFASVVVAHNALPNVARFGAQAAVDYAIPLGGGSELGFSGNGRYFGGSHLGSGPILDAAQGDYFNSEFLVTLSRGQRAVSLSISNPLDAKGNRFALGTPYQIYHAQATPLRPLTVRLGVDFRL